MAAMAPTAQLRWLVEPSPVLTAAMVIAARRTDETLMECKRRLTGAVADPVLQQLWLGPDGEEEWRAIPVAMTPRRDSLAG